ncbi:hypothetical protein RDI86_02345 [Cellulosimicrobium sp. XJ-DQ-B-000]|uniref:hypothetical protein n=1 Tax=Cellulosimicrobium sp. XJ-DQ-B-000 TaxID=3072182 RepID=UPI0028084012|nr:hypothetical protein [Cellulosimicrobium sp. XJ-DQ-B-000]MDQ8040682.1 hypothetical protein [Cellulosimicrobium sp. XJ-DQ-B-000]
MYIDRRGREWARWPDVTAPPGKELEISFDAGATWIPMEREDATTVRVLVAGPEAPTPHPEGTAVLRKGRNVATVRLSAAPEVLVRDAGIIHVR